MIHLAGPYVVAAILVGLGVMGVTVRRNAVLLLIGVELILSGSLVLLVASGATTPSRWESSSVLPLFVITIAAAEVVVALAVILTAFRHRGSIDLDEPLTDRLRAPHGHVPPAEGRSDVSVRGTKSSEGSPS
ncbi:NADH-quinone oxidoreductase subunit NuoK [Knoellia sp. CPCC 206453]|uniref:NADH-quinone oxidoreductase subunit NuoK n=1 Tax=Knoellia pratensis TaxID=3404796 RepID=UPI003623C402